MGRTSTTSIGGGNDIEAISAICFVVFMILCMIVACRKRQDKFQTDMQRHSQVYGRNPRQFTISV